MNREPRCAPHPLGACCHVEDGPDGKRWIQCNVICLRVRDTQSVVGARREGMCSDLAAGMGYLERLPTGHYV